MKIELTVPEVKQLLVWAEHAIEGGHFGDGNFMIPEEEITRNKLKDFKGGTFELSKMDIRILYYWAEANLGSSLNGMIPEEISIVEKLKQINRS
jgi:hypothetical protein